MCTTFLVRGLSPRDRELWRQRRLHRRAPGCVPKLRHTENHIAYDRDDAGEKAAQELAEELLAMGIDCYRVQFPKNMDATENALKVTPAKKESNLLLKKKSNPSDGALASDDPFSGEANGTRK